MSDTHFLFFKYRTAGKGGDAAERERRQNASAMVKKLGGKCEIFRISWNGFDMLSVVKGLNTSQVMKLAEEINRWGAVHTTVVTTSTAGVLKGGGGGGGGG